MRWWHVDPFYHAPVQLEALHLVNLGLEALPPALGSLSALRTLCLGCNRLGARPDALPAELARVRPAPRLFEGGSCCCRAPWP
jgi:hypothetical protein